MTDELDDIDVPASRLQTRLWNAVPDLPPADRRMAESIAGSEEPLTAQQKKAAWALIRKAETPHA